MKSSLLFAGAVIAVAGAAALSRSAQSSPSFAPSAPASAAIAFSTSDTSLARPDDVTTSTANAGPITVYVAGEVRRPGLYALPATARAQAALHAAGGPTSRADLIAVNLAEPLHDGEELVIVPRGAFWRRRRRFRHRRLRNRHLRFRRLHHAGTRACRASSPSASPPYEAQIAECADRSQQRRRNATRITPRGRSEPRIAHPRVSRTQRTVFVGR